jgi:3-methyladenine DNA glycosylase AlkD
MPSDEIAAHLHGLANPMRAAHALRYFKAEPGGYGHGDKFIGLTVPVVRQAVKKYSSASLDTAGKLLKSEYHEIRLFALLLLVARFGKSDEATQEKIYRLYLRHTRHINNWDLVDSSAPFIVGGYLRVKDRNILYQLAQSESLWKRRIAVMATFRFIRDGEFDDALRIAELLLTDPEDLIHKAVGWMLREIGKRDKASETAFLKAHYKNMPRTMLRYAIERFSPTERQKYLQGKI